MCGPTIDEDDSFLLKNCDRDSHDSHDSPPSESMQQNFRFVGFESFIFDLSAIKQEELRVAAPVTCCEVHCS